MGRDVVLDDDSTIALAADARLQVLTNDEVRFTTLLEAGSARFDVRPNGPRRWEIETGIATVEVVGTAFAVGVHDGQLEVAVTRGVVMIHGERVPNRVVRLTAGQRIVVGEPVAARATPPSPAPTQTPVEPQTTNIHRERPVEPPRPAVTEHPTESLAGVVAEADRLSGAGDPEGAARLLERVRLSGDPSSGLASFSLGRLYLDRLDKPELAAAAFGEVIDRGNPHSLIEDAYARRVEALIRAQLRDRAATALTEYEHVYPHGRRIATLRAMMHGP